MAGRKTKKLNPRRVPLPKSATNQDAIIDEATHNDMVHAWILVAYALVEQGISPDDIYSLSEQVNQYAKNHIAAKSEMEHAENLMGIGSVPHLDASKVKSYVELEKFRKKVEKVALHTAMSIICLGLESTGRFSNAELHVIFLSAALTEAEISDGSETYENLEALLLKKMVQIELSEELK